jgi:hypothetical protein
MVSTLAGIVMFLNEAADKNVRSGMVVMPSGMFIDFKDDVCWNAPAPMLVTLAGMVIDVSRSARRNASFPMLVTPVGIATAPVQLPPPETTPPAIMKRGAAPSLTPDAQL